MSLPTVLLPYQINWLMDRSPVRISEKSRRIGWSWSSACDAVLKAGARKGRNSSYIGYNKDMASEFMFDCAEWARNLNIAASDIDEFLFHDHEADKHIAAYRISFASRHHITALSSRPTTLRSRRGDVILDEAAFHDDLPGMLKSAIALLVWGNCQVSIISSHNGIDNPFNQLIDECRAGKRPFSVHRCTLDQAIQAGLYHRICLVTGQTWTPEAEAAWRQELFDFYAEDAQEELLCVPSSGSGKYLHRDVIRACMREGLPVLRLSLPDSFTLESAEYRESFMADWLGAEVGPHVSALDPHLKHYLGEDFGRTGDLTVLAPFCELSDLRYRTFLVELRNVPYDQQRQAVFWLCDRLPNFRHAAFDARGNGNYLAEVAMQRYYGRVSLVQLSQPWYLENMPKFRSALEERLLEIPQHADVLSDLLAIELVNGIPKIPDTKNKGTDGKPRHGDAAMALALGWYACHIEGAPAGGSIVTRQSPHYQSLHSGLFGRLR